MLYIILLIAGVALAANRKQQAGATPVTPAQAGTTETTVLPSFKYISDIFNQRSIFSGPAGPGIGIGLTGIGTGSVSPIVSGPYISTPSGPVTAPSSGSAAPGGGGTSGGTIPSGTGSGGSGLTGPGGFRTPNTL